MSSNVAVRMDRLLSEIHQWAKLVPFSTPARASMVSVYTSAVALEPTSRLDLVINQLLV